MKQIIRNVLPQDTRSIELPSSVGLLIVCVFLFFDLLTGHHIFNIHPEEFWAIFLAVIGGLQLYALLDYPKMDLLRTAMCWVAGSFWLWIAFVPPIDISSVAAFGMGFSNIVAFIINTVIISEKWK